MVFQPVDSKPARCISSESITYPRHLFSSYSAGEVGFGIMNKANFSNIKWRSLRMPTLRFYHTEFETAGHHGPAKFPVKQRTFCDMILCVKKYSFSISNGVPVMDVASERYGSWYYNRTDFNEPTWVDIPGRNGFVLNENGTGPQTNISFREFKVSLSERNMVAFSNSDTILNGQLDIYENLVDEGWSCISNHTVIQVDKRLPPISASHFWLENLNLARIVDKGGLPLVVSRMTAAASRLFRDKDVIPVKGKVHRSIIIVDIRWPWVALPATIWLFAVMFLALTIRVCRENDPALWKTSSLPLIYHGFKDRDVVDMKAAGSGLERVSGMEKFSENLIVRIRRDSSDGQLKLTKTVSSA